MNFHKIWNALQPGNWVANKLFFSEAISWLQKAIVFFIQAQSATLGQNERIPINWPDFQNSVYV